MSIYNSTDEDYNYTYYNDTDDNCLEFFKSAIRGAGLLVIFALSVLANGLLIYIVVRFEDTRKVSNLFFLCLASFSLLFTLTQPFLAVYYLHHWVFGEAACKIVRGAFFTGVYGSLLLLTAMTLDRFCTVVLKGRPLTQPGRRLQCARVVCVATWVISIAAGIRYLVISRTVFVGDVNKYYCSNDPSGELNERHHYYMEVVLLFLIPLGVIVFCYGCILRTVLSVPHMRDRRRTVVHLFCHIIAFIICFVPFNVVLYYKKTVVIRSGCDANYEMLYLISYFLSRSYCVVNPVFYLLRPSVRTAVYQHVCCLKPTSHLRTSRSNSNDNTA